MVNQQTLQGNWNEIKGKLRNKWGQLTNDDLQMASGNVDQLVGLIQRKTGEASSSLEKFLADTAREYAQQAMEAVQDRSKQATEQVRKGYDQAAESFRRGYEQTEEMIKD